MGWLFRLLPGCITVPIVLGVLYFLLRMGRTVYAYIEYVVTVLFGWMAPYM